MHQEGTAYVIKWAEEKLPDFIGDLPEEEIGQINNIKKSKWTTLFISGGRKDKISKGDIAGFFLKKGELKKDELGVIELLQECSFVAVPHNKIKELIHKLNNQHVKKRKVRVYEI